MISICSSSFPQQNGKKKHYLLLPECADQSSGFRNLIREVFFAGKLFLSLPPTLSDPGDLSMYSIVFFVHASAHRFTHRCMCPREESMGRRSCFFWVKMQLFDTGWRFFNRLSKGAPMISFRDGKQASWGSYQHSTTWILNDDDDYDDDGIEVSDIV